MLAKTNPSVKAFEDRRKKEADTMLLAKSEHTIHDIPSWYPFVFQSFFGQVFSWEDAFMKNPKKASKQFRSMLNMTHHAGTSESVDYIKASKAERLLSH